MNIYDPRDGITYRHLDQRCDAYSVPVTISPRVDPLPAGYANGSPGTYLGRSRRISSAA